MLFEINLTRFIEKWNELILKTPKLIKLSL